MAVNPRIARGSVHNQLRFYVHSIAACVFVSVTAVANQGTSSVWTASDLLATPTTTVSGGEGKLTADAGARLVEVTGAIDRGGTAAPSAALSDVNLSGWVTRDGLTVSRRSVVMAVGIKDNTGTCSYLFPHVRVRGVSSRLADAAGNGFELKKEGENDPAVITLLKRPTQLCLAFQIPARPLRTVTLRLGSNDFKVPVGPDRK